jgi:Lanthionine synthetase C-like protein
MLHRPEQFEPLTDEPWDEERVRNRIRAIVADADAVYSPESLWPSHLWDIWGEKTSLKSLYIGAAGVVWALGELRRRGYGGTLDLAAASERTLELWRKRTDFERGDWLPSTAKSALLAGESGILVVAWEHTRDPKLADDLFDHVAANEASEADELMWGSPGTLLGAGAMYAWTGDERWAAAWREGAAALLQRRDADGLWTQRLYRTTRRLCVPHGVPGNVAVLLGGGELLGEEERERLRRETAAVLARTAVIEDGMANWPDHEGEWKRKVQWCAGAAGVVAAAADYLDEELLLAGAELVWHAGPFGTTKGPALCHGTAGNGYALLKTFARTGDEVWLERARRFAVHALGQVDRRRRRLGSGRGALERGRYSLWTGDVGTALFAADCVDARAEFPIVDSWANPVS